MSDLYGVLHVEAEIDAARAIHRRRWWVHRLLWNERGHGYCAACVPLALDAITAACDDSGRLRTLGNTRARQRKMET